MARVSAKFINFGTGAGQVSAQNIPVSRVPQNYTPVAEGSEGTDKVSALLKGIDEALNPSYSADVSTTDSTTTLLQTFTPATNQLLYFESKIFAVRTGGTAGLDGDTGLFVRSGKIKNVGGVVSLGAIQSNYTHLDQTSWATQFTTDGTSLLVSVAGADNNNVDWHVVTTVFVYNF